MSTRTLKAIVFANCLWPLAFILYDARTGGLGANPIDYVTRATGTLALLFLALTLAITPLRQLTGWSVLNKLRRMIGLFAFFYATLHLGTYVWWDQELAPAAIARDVAARPFVAVGLAAWLILVPLAVTSTNRMVKRLGGKRWKLLHRLTYLAAGLGVLHFFWLLKVPTGKLYNYAAVIAGLLAVRVVMWAVKRRSKPAGRPRPTASQPRRDATAG